MQKEFLKKILLSNLIAFYFLQNRDSGQKNVRLPQAIDVEEKWPIKFFRIFYDVKKICYVQKPHVECVQEADKEMFINIKGQNILFQNLI